MGVRRAMALVLSEANKRHGRIFTFGPLIHNEQVLSLLESKGVTSVTDLTSPENGTLVIRAHGIPPEGKENLEQAGFKVIDATCPRVIKVQTIIRKHEREGYASIIIGDKAHPEVVGLLGYAGKKGYVVDNLKDLNSLQPFDKAIIVAQTTQNKIFFEEVKHWAERKYPHYKVFDTICDSTAKRQEEVRRLADSVDTFIVVGGHNSGNTKRLAEIATQTGKPTYQIES